MNHYLTDLYVKKNFEAMTDNSRLTRREAELIEKTWRNVGSSVEMAIDFYNRLFYQYPVVRPLFKENMRLQARKLTSQITELISTIQEEMAHGHETGGLSNYNSYDSKSGYYNEVKEALLFSLKNHLKNDWNDHVEMAWIKFYKIIADNIINLHA